MLCWILIVGGLLIMMGQHDRSETLFYYFRLEDQVPENHLLRLIDKHISFEFVRRQLKASYSETGRPSNRSRTSVAHAVDWVSVRHHQRAQTGGRTAHAFGVALVHGLGFRSRNPASLHVLEKSAWTVSGIEAVRGAV